MSAPPAALVWVTEDPTRHLALITGRGKLRQILDDAGLGETARWSRSGHGWVIPAATVPDLRAACEWRSIPIRTRTRPEGQPT